MIVVFDVNVLIPLILDASRSTRLFRRLIANGDRVAASLELLNEVADKLQRKDTLRKWLAASDDEIHQFLRDLPFLLTIVPGVLQVHGAVPDDPDDDAVISVAVESGASFVITEDWHLLKLKTFRQITILSRDDMERELDRLGIPPLPPA